MSREEMLEYIRQNLDDADTETVAYIYWVLIENE